MYTICAKASINTQFYPVFLVHKLQPMGIRAWPHQGVLSWDSIRPRPNLEAPNWIGGGLARPLCQGHDGGHTGWVYAVTPTFIQIFLSLALPPSTVANLGAPFPLSLLHPSLQHSGHHLLLSAFNQRHFVFFKSPTTPVFAQKSIFFLPGYLLSCCGGTLWISFVFSPPYLPFTTNLHLLLLYVMRDLLCLFWIPTTPVLSWNPSFACYFLGRYLSCGLDRRERSVFGIAGVEGILVNAPWPQDRVGRALELWGFDLVERAWFRILGGVRGGKGGG